MKTGLTRKQKVTEFYFNEHDDLAEIYTHNTDLKKRLLAYAKEYPELCQLTEDDEQGGLRFEIDKHRIGIVFISHRLDEIINVSDRVTVLRDGEWVATKDTKDLTAAEIARLMVGRALTLERNESKRVISDEPMLEVKNLRVNMPGEVVKGVDFTVRKGEVVGIGGLAGQGKLGIANGIMGLYPADGQVKFKGQELRLNDTKAALKADLAFVSEDRKGVGLLLNSPIDMNIAFTAQQIEDAFIKKVGPFKVTDKKAIREHADKMIKELDIRCTSAAQNTGSLSGGNQQKVCVARALTQSPELLLVSEPTRGIDIGAKKLILDLLKHLADRDPAAYIENGIIHMFFTLVENMSER